MGLRMDRLEAAVLPEPGPPIPVEEEKPALDPTDRIDALRILDACANRAREGLRVVEDYCRFVLDDAFLCGELKRLRHDLTAALAVLPAEHLLEARETQQRRGRRTIHARGAGTVFARRRGPGELEAVAGGAAQPGRVRQNGRRPTSAGRWSSCAIAATRWSARRPSAPRRGNGWTDVRLCVLLTGSQCVGPLEWTVKEAAAGGAGMIQLREKDLSDRELLERAREVRRWTREAGVLFIVNDRPDVARLVEADGVHLGQDDLPVKEARRILGPDALIGVSTHTIEQVRQAVLDGASYLGVGPTFPSRTKKFSEFPGLDFVRAVAAETTLPAFVIGGVNLDTVRRPRRRGRGGRRSAKPSVRRPTRGRRRRRWCGRCRPVGRPYNFRCPVFPTEEFSCDPIRSSRR